MATSGSSDFSVQRNDIIREAFELGGIIRAGAAMAAHQTEKGSRVLNAMVKNWAASGIHIWTVSEATLFMQADQIQYALGSTSTDHCALTSDVVSTTLSADEASGQTALSVTSDDGIADNDYIAIQLDDGTFHFTQVNGTPAGDVVTIDVALTDSAASGAKVYCYTNKIVRPLKIVAARRKSMTDDNEVNLTPISRLDYRALARKAEPGLPSQFFYDAQLTLGQLYVYQVESSISELLNFTWHRPIEDFDTAADNPDLPQEWIKALHYGLAHDLGDSYDIPQQRYQRIENKLVAIMAGLAGHDREEESLQFSPAMSGR